MPADDWPLAGSQVATKNIAALFLRTLKKALTSASTYFIIPLNTGKEVIKKYMSSNHSEVAAA